MAYSLADLEKEITDSIENEKSKGNSRIPADWVAQKIISAHADIHGEDKDFYKICTYRTVREQTRKVMSAYQKGEIKTDAQMVMTGFELLQTYYVISTKTEDGEVEQVQVHVDAMTYDELTAKAKEHETLSLTHAKHKEEIYRFRDDKFKEQAA